MLNQEILNNYKIINPI